MGTKREQYLKKTSNEKSIKKDTKLEKPDKPKKSKNAQKNDNSQNSVKTEKAENVERPANPKKSEGTNIFDNRKETTIIKKFQNFIGIKNSEKNTSRGSIIIASTFLFAVLLEFYFTYRRLQGEIFSFNGKQIAMSLKSSVVIPVFITFIGFLEIIERVFGIEEIKVKRKFAWVIFLICLIFITSSFLSCSNGNDANYLKNEDKTSIPKNSILHDYRFDTFHYRVDLESVLTPGSYKFTGKESEKQLENILLYLKNVMNDIFVPSIGEPNELPSYIKMRAKMLKNCEELFDSVANNITKQNLQRLYVLTSLIPIDAYCRNQNLFKESLEFNYENSLEEILNWIETHPVINGESIEDIKYLGSMKNLNAVIFALRNAPKSKLILRQKILKRVEQLCGVYLECENVIRNLEIDTLYCDILLNSLEQWKSENQDHIISNTQEKITLYPENVKCLGLTDSLTLILGTSRSGVKLDSLEDELIKHDSKIKEQLTIKQNRYLPYIQDVKLIKKNIILSLIAKHDDIASYIEELNKTVDSFKDIEYNESEVQKINSTLYSELVLLDTKDNDDNKNYDKCADIFNMSFQKYKSALVDHGYNFSDEIFEKALIPEINLFICGLNWDIPILTSIKKIDPDFQEFVLNGLRELISLYETIKKLEMDTLITSIESQRLYFDYGRELLKSNSENQLGRLALNIIRLSDLAKFFNQKFIIQIHGHNGASMERFRNAVKFDINYRSLDILACWIAVKRSEYVKDLMESYDIGSYFTSYSFNDYNDAVKNFDLNGNRDKNLWAILEQVKPFKIMEQSVTFKVILINAN